MPKQFHGLIAMFETTPEVVRAAEKVREAGYKFWDVHSPLPIHGIDRAMGTKRSRVPRISLAGGITGFCTGMTMIWYTDGFDYKLTVGGKPFFSPLFAFPVSYELTILFTAFATIIGMFILNGLPMHYHPVLKYPNVDRATNDLFYIVIESRDPKFDSQATRALLAEIGGQAITELED